MIYLFDFNDSFTYNIFSQLKLINPKLEIKLVPYELHLSVLEELVDTNLKTVVIFGPGPGHPDDYKDSLSFIPKILENSSLFFMGICLGHQLLWRAKGLKVEVCERPIHGQVCEYLIGEEDYFRKILNLEDSKLKVQRYNSLCILEPEFKNQTKGKQFKSFFQEGELVMTAGNNFLTYQFHPESVGTTCPSSYFTPILDFLL